MSEVLFHGTNKTKFRGDKLIPQKTVVRCAPESSPNRKGCFVLATQKIEMAMNFAFTPKRTFWFFGYPISIRWGAPVFRQFSNSQDGKTVLYGLICKDLNSYLKNVNKQATILDVPKSKFKQVIRSDGRESSEWVCSDPVAVMSARHLTLRDALKEGMQIFYAKNGRTSIKKLEKLAKKMEDIPSSIPVLKKAIAEGFVGHYNQDLYSQGDKEIKVFDFDSFEE